MDETEIKTRQGLILEFVVSAALGEAGYAHAQDFQYDETCEKPDFLIPDEKTPQFMVEVHQTEVRNSFQMKTLRGFTAVTEAKANYGSELVSVNILFGDPEKELPAGNVRAMCGFFDCNILPRRDSKSDPDLLALEKAALVLAKDEDYSTEQAAKEIIKDHPNGVKVLALLVKQHLSAVKANPFLFPVWKAEQKRTATLTAAPKAGDQTLYKRMMLRSLYLSDQDFANLVKNPDPVKASASLQTQLVKVGLASLVEELDGDKFILDNEFELFLADKAAPGLRELCRISLSCLPGLAGFFEDIRESKRRQDMVSQFIAVLKSGKAALVQALVECIKSTNYSGINHSRCWVAELMSLAVEASQNEFNRRMVQTKRDPENYQYPFNNITGRFERLMGCPNHWKPYATFAVEVFAELCTEKGQSVAKLTVDSKMLEDRLLRLRIDGAIKLQKFNPLYAVLIEESSKLGLVCEPIKVKSLVFDLAGGKGRLGKYNAFKVADTKTSVLVVPVAVHDNNGDHKSKEWGARRLASLYRCEKNVVRLSEFQAAIYVLDGDWKDKDVARLHRSGWNYVIRLGQLESTLKKFFNIKGTPARTKVNLAAVIEEEEPPDEG